MYAKPHHTLYMLSHLISALTLTRPGKVFKFSKLFTPLQKEKNHLASLDCYKIHLEKPCKLSKVPCTWQAGAQSFNYNYHYYGYY